MARIIDGENMNLIGKDNSYRNCPAYLHRHWNSQRQGEKYEEHYLLNKLSMAYNCNYTDLCLLLPGLYKQCSLTFRHNR